MPTDSDTLHPSEGDLAHLAGQLRYDRFLQELAGSADLHVGTPVGLLANGMFIYGSLAPARMMAEQVDLHYATVLDLQERKGMGDEESRAASRKLLTDAMVKREDRAAANRKRITEEGEEAVGDADTYDVLDLPADLAREEIQMRSRPALTLMDVTIIAQGQQPAQVPVMRVHLAQVAGWWIVQERNPDGTARIEHPPRKPPNGDNAA